VNSQWSRDVDGVIAGVCKALASRFKVDIMLVRLAWVFSVLFFGFGLGLYIVLALGLPRSDKLGEAKNPRLLGVCSRFAQRFDLDIGLTRSGFGALLLCTAGTVFFVYILLYFILPKQSELDAKPQLHVGPMRHE
jgi:phage shock protein C